MSGNRSPIFSPSMAHASISDPTSRVPALTCPFQVSLRQRARDHPRRCQVDQSPDSAPCSAAARTQPCNRRQAHRKYPMRARPPDECRSLCSRCARVAFSVELVSATTRRPASFRRASAGRASACAESFDQSLVEIERDDAGHSGVASVDGGPATGHFAGRAAARSVRQFDQKR